MNLNRVIGVLYQEYFVTKRSFEVITDIFYSPIVNIFLFGFVSMYLLGGKSSTQAYYLLSGMILWEVVRVAQYSVAVGSLWNIWARNLSNMFISPLTFSEYLCAQMLSGIIKSLIVFFTVAFICLFLFQFNIFIMGFVNLLLFFINLTLFAWTVGIVVLALLFRFGTRIQAFAWSIIIIFQPITAALYPVTVLPSFLQTIAWWLPVTYVFEAARQSLTTPEVNWYFAEVAFAQNIVYFLLSIWFFNIMFRLSKKSGQFARMEG